MVANSFCVKFLIHGNFRLCITISFKLYLDRNQEELERWSVAAKQKEEDSLALQKYTRADEAKIREINFLIENLTKNQLNSKVRVMSDTLFIIIFLSPLIRLTFLLILISYTFLFLFDFYFLRDF